MNSHTDALSLRPATLEDLDSIVEVEVSSHWTKAQFEAELTKPLSNTLVFTDDETDSRVFGFIVFSMIADEMEILNLAVDRAHRRTGLGRRLVAAAVNLALKKGVNKAFLEVRKSNTSAIALYQQAGFSVFGVRKGYYRNPTGEAEDAFTMRIDLSESLRHEFDNDEDSDQDSL